MSLAIDRRLLLKAGMFGVGALAVPGAAEALGGRGFTHDVASGEPGRDRVLLWTRYVPRAGTSGRLRCQVAEDEGFSRIAGEGAAEASPEHDFCVKPVVGGLAPGRWYFYRFIDDAGRRSPTGRTRTLPDGGLEPFRIGVFSCSNIGFGWFNAYAHAAARRDLDLVLHLGDYLYEYRRGEYPVERDLRRPRAIDPPNEIVQLADYRLRHAAYRRDPDLRRLHRLYPVVPMWDDHESANDAWEGGAENHQPETEGDWHVRKAAAMRAYREWLPVSDDPWQSYEIGDLATLYRLETRLTARTRQLDIGAALSGRDDVGAALVEFRDGAWRDPARTLMGAEQESWLAEGLRRSVARGAKWQLLAQQVIMGSLRLSPETAGLVNAGAGEALQRQMRVGLAASQAGLPFNLDIWDGYPAARARVLRSALDAGANLIALSGDSHNAWAFDLDLDGAAAGVDLAVQSVTSPGFEGYLPWVNPADLARTTVAFNPQLQWAETSRRGYMTVELTAERVRSEWLFLDTVRRRSTAIAARHAMSIAHGARRLG